MEFEGFKSAWQKRSVNGREASSPVPISRSLQFLRTSAIRDVQRSDELSRLLFCLLFALVAIAASVVVMPPGANRIAAWLFALALLVDGVTGWATLTRRLRAPSTTTMLEFISREHRLLETRLRLERFSRRLMLVLLAGALVVLLFAPRPLNLRDNALDALVRMVILTAFLAFAWRRAKSRSGETHRELERYLKELEG